MGWCSDFRKWRRQHIRLFGETQNNWKKLDEAYGTR